MTLTLTGWLADSALGGGKGEGSARRGSSIAIFVASAIFGAFLVRYGVIWPVLTAFVIFTLARAPLLRPVDQAAGERATRTVIAGRGRSKGRACRPSWRGSSGFLRSEHRWCSDPPGCLQARSSGR